MTLDTTKDENNLGSEDNGTTGGLDLGLGTAGDVAGLDNDGLLGETTLAKNLAVTGAEGVNDGDNLLVVGVLETVLLGDKVPEVADIDDGAVLGVALQVEVAHTNLTKVTGMVLVKVDTVVVLTTSKTTTSGMLPVLTDTTVTGRDVSALLAVLVKMGRLIKARERER